MKSISWYTSKLDSNPITTKTISSIFIFAIGDFLCQKIENKIEKKTQKKDFNWMRLIKQSSYGLLAGPYLHLQFCRIIPAIFPSTAKLHVFKSVFYALTVSDAIYNCGFYVYCDALNGEFFKAKTFFEKFVPTQMLNLQVWPVFQYVNFSLVPIKYRVLYDNMLAVFWNAYLSYVQNNMEKANL